MSREEVSTERLTQKPWPPPCRQQGREDVAVVVAGERDVLEADAALVEEGAVAVGGVDHGEAALVELEMTLDQRAGCRGRWSRSRS